MDAILQSSTNTVELFDCVTRVMRTGYFFAKATYECPQPIVKWTVPPLQELICEQITKKHFASRLRWNRIACTALLKNYSRKLYSTMLARALFNSNRDIVKVILKYWRWEELYVASFSLLKTVFSFSFCSRWSADKTFQICCMLLDVYIELLRTSSLNLKLRRVDISDCLMLVKFKDVLKDVCKTHILNKASVDDKRMKNDEYVLLVGYGCKLQWNKEQKIASPDLFNLTDTKLLKIEVVTVTATVSPTHAFDTLEEFEKPCNLYLETYYRCRRLRPLLPAFTLAVPRFHNLRSLYFERIMVRNELGKILSLLPTGLEQLVLDRTCLSGLDLTALADSHHSRTLRSLAIKHHELDEYADQLLHLIKQISGSIEVLCLRRCGLLGPNYFVEELVTALKECRHLVALDIAQNSLCCYDLKRFECLGALPDMILLVASVPVHGKQGIDFDIYWGFDRNRAEECESNFKKKIRVEFEYESDCDSEDCNLNKNPDTLNVPDFTSAESDDDTSSDEELEEEEQEEEEEEELSELEEVEDVYSALDML